MLQIQNGEQLKELFKQYLNNSIQERNEINIQPKEVETTEVIENLKEDLYTYKTAYESIITQLNATQHTLQKMTEENRRLASKNSSLRLELNSNKHLIEENKYLFSENKHLQDKIDNQNKLIEELRQKQISEDFIEINKAIEVISKQLNNGVFIDYKTYSDIINQLSISMSQGVITSDVYDKLISLKDVKESK